MLLLRIKAALRRWLTPSGVTMRGDLEPRQPHGLNTPKTIEEGAANLVDRARQNDQNARAMILEIGKNARAGDPTAKRGYAAIEGYIKAHPAKNVPTFGEELAHNRRCDLVCGDMMAGFGEDYIETVKDQLAPAAAMSLPKAIVTVANGPSLLPDGEQNLFQDVRDAFDGKERKAFLLGLKHGLQELNRIPRELQAPFVVGHILGTARKIQAVRCPNVPLSVLSTRLGAEFGERSN